jgi:hypothetical protein
VLRREVEQHGDDADVDGARAKVVPAARIDPDPAVVEELVREPLADVGQAADERRQPDRAMEADEGPDELVAHAGLRPSGASPAGRRMLARRQGRCERPQPGGRCRSGPRVAARPEDGEHELPFDAGRARDPGKARRERWSQP